jgi:hypothetical protein
MENMEWVKSVILEIGKGKSFQTNFIKLEKVPVSFNQTLQSKVNTLFVCAN